MANAPTQQYLQDLIDRDTAKIPEKESLADRNCPVCGAGIHWDALNDRMKDAPAFCTACGQRFDWSTERKYNEY